MTGEKKLPRLGKRKTKHKLTAKLRELKKDEHKKFLKAMREEDEFLLKQIEERQDG